MSEHVRKGRLVHVEGRLQVRHYEKDGQRREVVEVVAQSVLFVDRPPQVDDEDDLGEELPV